MRSFVTFIWLTTFCTIAALAAQPKRRPVRRPEADAPSREQNADDIASMSYVGGNIPSKCFRMLQQSVGEPEASEWLTHCVTIYVTDCASNVIGIRVLSCHVFQLILFVFFGACLLLTCCNCEKNVVCRIITWHCAFRVGWRFKCNDVMSWRNVCDVRSQSEKCWMLRGLRLLHDVRYVEGLVLFGVSTEDPHPAFVPFLPVECASLLFGLRSSTFALSTRSECCRWLWLTDVYHFECVPK